MSLCVQSMRRGYTREAYLDLIHHIRSTVPDVAISSDFIAGFCGETDADHADTVSLIQQVQFDQAFMFAYSMRERTHAYYKMTDDVPEDVKLKRLQQVWPPLSRLCCYLGHVLSCVFREHADYRSVQDRFSCTT